MISKNKNEEKNENKVKQINSLCSILSPFISSDIVRFIIVPFVQKEVWKEDKILRGHTGPVCSVCCIPTIEKDGNSSSFNGTPQNEKGKKVISGSEDGTICIWCSETGELLHTLYGHTHGVISVCCFSFNGTPQNEKGTKIISGSRDKTVRIWCAETGQLLHTLRGHTALIRSVCCINGNSPYIDGNSPSLNGTPQNEKGSKIVSGSDDCTVRIWCSGTGQLLHTLRGHTKCIMSVCISHDESKIISGSEDGTVRIWCSRTGQLLHTLVVEGYGNSINSVFFNYDCSRIISIHHDHIARIWCSETGQLLRTLRVCYNWAFFSTCFSQDSDHMVSGADYGCVRIWCSRNGKLLQTLYGHTGYVSSVCFFNGNSSSLKNEKGPKVVSGSDDCTVRLWKREFELDLSLEEKKGSYCSML